jgi:hypothetical protein
MGYFKLENKIQELKAFAEHGLADLKLTGLPVLDTYFKLKKGYPLFVAGNPGSGKTEFIFEILINTSILYEWKHFIYCGEGGNIEHIYNELIFKYLQNPYKWADEKEKLNAEYFISQHFIIADHDKDYSIEDFYKTVEKCETELGWKFDTTTFDPFNDIKDDLKGFDGREDKYLAHALKECRISSKKNNRIDILINHVADVQMKVDKETNKNYLPAALPTQWAGGRTWWRRAFTMILVYRPPIFLKDTNGEPYAENESHIIIQKSKPKGVGKLGKASIFWDWKKNRYYCKMPNGQELYSCQTVSDISPKLEPNRSFIDGINKLNDDQTEIF